MPDVDFCSACLTLAERTVGTWETAPDAPDTYEDLARLWLEHGRMVVTDRWSPEDHPHFTDAHAYAAFRAWHDYLHVTYVAPFGLNGECRTVAIHEAQLCALHGRDKAQEWRAILHYELIENNYGLGVQCPSA